MKLISSVLIFVISLCAVKCTENGTDHQIIPAPPITPVIPTSTPNPSPSPKTTTVEPPKPSPSPTQPTPPPTKPTPPPTNPTPPPTKPTPPPTKPTPPPTKPTPPPTNPTPPPTKPTTPSTTTVAPTPSKPEVGDWNVTRPNSNSTCIKASMAIRIDVSCSVGNKTEGISINVPKNATSNGNCDKDIEQLSLTWDEKKNAQDIVQFRFVKNTTSAEVKVDNINVILNGIDWLNATEPMNFTYNKTEFETTKDHSYKCKKEQSLTLVPIKKSNCTVTITVSDLHIQAFMNSTTNSFGEAIDCLNSSTPDIVPIAVGCALAALVVVVLLAYLYGRRRSQARGYLSM